MDIARAARTALEWDAFVPNEQSTSTVFWLSLRQLVRDQRSCLSVPAHIRMNCCGASRSISRQCCPPMRQCSRESLRCFPSLRSMWVRSVAWRLMRRPRVRELQTFPAIKSVRVSRLMCHGSKRYSATPSWSGHPYRLCSQLEASVNSLVRGELDGEDGVLTVKQF